VRPSRLIAAGVALVLAGALLVLAADVTRWRDAMRADDAAFAAGRQPSWHAEAIVPFGAARRLLAVDDDRALRRAVLAYRGVAGHASSFNPSTVRRARIEAELALADVAASQSGATASQADDLLGILAFADATSGGTAGRSAPVERSITAFANAVQLDGHNTAAKYNLELLLRLLEAHGQRSGGTPSAGPRGGGKRGAGGGTPGRGY
jgi:hypothetical protein